jgi:hypothetical protein
MSVANCIAKLVQAGQITKQTGDEALDLHRRSMAKFAETMGPADADAAAAAAVARSIAAGAKKMKYDTAKSVLSWAEVERKIHAHPKGAVAGLMSQLTTDIHEKAGLGGQNVYTKTEVIAAQLSNKLNVALNAYMPGLLGRTAEKLAGVQRMFYEVFGVDTGDQVAKAAARGWTEAIEEGVARAISAGRNIVASENWRFMQPWNSERVRKFELDEWKTDWQTHLDSGGVTLWDKHAGKPAKDAADQERILERAWKDIRANDNSPSVFSDEMRTFEFAEGKAGADAYLAMQAKYGMGDNLIGGLVGHLSGMAREIALAEILGPNHAANFKAGMKIVRELEGVSRPTNPVIRMLESPKRLEQVYDVLTGRANVVDGPVVAGVMGGIRSLGVAAKLGGASITSFFGDTPMAAFAAIDVGMPVTRMLDGVMRELARGGPESKALATRNNLVAHSAIDYAHGFRHFGDRLGGPESLQWLATTVIRTSGLEAWTNLIKRVFSMEMMGHLVDHAGHNLDELRAVNRPLAQFMDRHQISAADWDVIRATQPFEAEGVKFLQASEIADEVLREKLLGAVVHERRYAMLEPDARIRAITTGGLPQGTFHGEMARSLFMFKSFSMTMLSTHIMRMATMEEGRAARAAWFAVFTTLAGAATLQTKNIIYGRDPESMGTASFWAKAGLTGGGLAIFGDLTQSAFSKTGRSPLADLAGPVVGLAEDVGRLTSGQIRKWYEGDDTTFAAEGVRFARRWTPNVFYTRLAQERMVFDRIQMLADPDYRASWRRQEQRMKDDAGQQFWFRPGQTVPTRGPNLRAALP